MGVAAKVDAAAELVVVVAAAATDLGERENKEFQE